MGTQTERLMNLPDVEEIFQRFVRNANAASTQSRTRRGDGRKPKPSVVPPPVVSLSSLPIKKLGLESESTMDAPEVTRTLLDHEEALAAMIAEDLAALEEEDAEPVELVRRTSRPPRPLLELQVDSVDSVDSVHAVPGSNTQRIEAEKVVPDVASVAPPAAPVPERSELGEIPPRELERCMVDMEVLLRYGHKAEVARRLDELHAKYPNDLLLLRRIAEFHLRTGSEEAAKECLFKLASTLFERRNVHGMRAALQQVLVLDPRNPRAHRLLALLERRQDPA